MLDPDQKAQFTVPTFLLNSHVRYSILMYKNHRGDKLIFTGGRYERQILPVGRIVFQRIIRGNKKIDFHRVRTGACIIHLK
jgi:hypothetical protein